MSGAAYGTGGEGSARASSRVGSIDGGGDLPLLGDGAPLSWQKKLCFALGSLPNALTVTTTGFFLNPFLLEVAGINASLVSALMLVGRGWDALTTAFVGALVARSGGLRKWLAIALPPTCAAYFFLWMVIDGSTGAKAGFAFAMYLSYQLFSSMYQVPYTAMTVRLHHDSEERDKATTWRMLAEISSVLVGAGGQSVILALYDANDDCRSCDDDGTSSDAAKAYLISAVVMTALFGVGGIVCFIGIDDGKPGVATEKKEAPPAREGIRAAFQSRSFVCLTFAYFFIWLTVQAVQGNIMLYCKYTVPTWKDQFQVLLGVLVVTSTFGMPCWLKIMGRIGKRRAYILGGAGFAPLLHILYWLPDDAPLWPGVLTCLFAGFFLSAAYLLPWSMMPNVVDEVEFHTGKRYEAVFYAFFVFFMKMGAGIALAGSALILGAAGWVDDPCCEALPDSPIGICDCNQRDLTCNCEVQPDSVGDALRYVIGIGGPCLVLVGVGFAYFYPLDTDREIEIQMGLDARRGAGGESPGSPVTGEADFTASMRHSVPSLLASARTNGTRRTMPADLSGSTVRPRDHRTLSLPSPGLDKDMTEIKTG
eukprot:TRINITY_DN1306_c0_g2_i1.p1 TRINITY_DN1306_c0_g2~~TRINITY_DN1306_c0_g2_i1.p1  ORF type:complete len:619 (+),score=173.43 TRINITY_DN1306_c0_g2_i1:83-1858(+)